MFKKFLFLFFFLTPTLAFSYDCKFAEGIQYAKDTADDTKIHLDQKIEHITVMLEADPTYCFGSGKIATPRMTEAQKEALDEIDTKLAENYMGVPKRIHWGVAPVYMLNTNKLVGAAFARIQLTPRNYYTPILAAPWSRWTHDNNINPPELPWESRIDLNVGVSTASNTSESNGSDNVSNFLLTGLSYELHREAFLNLGWAVAINSPKRGGQWYVGITIDENILKSIGLIK